MKRTELTYSRAFSRAKEYFNYAAALSPGGRLGDVRLTAGWVASVCAGRTVVRERDYAAASPPESPQSAV